MILLLFVNRRQDVEFEATNLPLRGPRLEEFALRRGSDETNVASTEIPSPPGSSLFTPTKSQRVARGGELRSLSAIGGGELRSLAGIRFVS